MMFFLFLLSPCTYIGGCGALVSAASAAMMPHQCYASSSSSSSSSSASASASVLASCRGGGGDGGGGGGEEDEGGGDEDLLASVLGEMQSALSSAPSLKIDGNVASAIDDFSSATSAGADSSNRGAAAFRFLSSLSSSTTFVSRCWHRRPLLIRSGDAAAWDDSGSGGNGVGSWVDGAFTVERDLKLIGGSYISGHKTADPLRDGTKTDTWDFRPLRDNTARKTTWEDFETSLHSPTSGGGTVYFNTAGSLWPSLGALCRLTGYAFGLPTNVNVYVTPPGVTTSVPPHTDRQDVLVFQTEGAKRWRVYGPPRRRRGSGSDPLNRGKSGDVLTFEEMGEPLIDAVVRRGDVLYVPAGFPHTTDTCTVVDDNDEAVGADTGGPPIAPWGDIFNETSVHLTMGLDTHVWGLTYAHARWSALQRAGKRFQVSIEEDDTYWDSLETIPVGFLAGPGWRDKMTCGQGGSGSVGQIDGAIVDDELRNKAVRELKRVMVRLEPERWKGAAGFDGADSEEEKEEFPSDEELAQVVDYMIVDHLGGLMGLQEEMFTEIDPHRDETLIKAYQCTQKQNKIMENFGAFSKNEAMRRSFEENRLKREAMTKGL